MRQVLALIISGITKSSDLIAPVCLGTRTDKAYISLIVVDKERGLVERLGEEDAFMSSPISTAAATVQARQNISTALLGRAAKITSHSDIPGLSRRHDSKVPDRCSDR